MGIKGLIKEKILEVVSSEYEVNDPNFVVEHPDNENHGDYATNIALTLPKMVKQSPMDIAKNIAYKLEESSLTTKVDGKTVQIFDSVETLEPGFINFFLSKNWLKSVLREVHTKQDNYGAGTLGEETTVLVEYSQPNPNKPLHIGHARNNFLGSSLSAIYKFLNYNAIEANYMNDWGTHICKSMLMYKKLAQGEEPKIKPDHYVGDLYVKYEKEEEKNPEIKEEVAELFRKLEEGDPETVKLWEKITKWVYKGWEKTYADQNVEFDVWFYQSDYRDTGKEIVQDALDAGIAEKDDTGAVIARLEKYGIPDKVLLRSDGTSVYATQDIQLAKDGYEKHKYAKRLYVVDYRQSDYFKQVFKIAKHLGYGWADKLEHVPYGTVELPEGKMSSRRGMVVDSDEVFDELIRLEKEEIKKSIKDVEDVEETARKVALAAFRYGMLKVDPTQNMVFKYEDVTKFEGNTGPYLLYTYARARSVLKKGDFSGKAELNKSLLDKYNPNERELAIIRELYKLPEVVQSACDKLAPHLIATFVYEVAQKFNTFYSEVPIATAESKEEREFRLLLTACSAQIIKNSLHLLGIQVVEKM